MISNDFSGIVLRYKNSTNKDKKNDYVKMMRVIENRTELTEKERTEVENDVINHFLNISPRGKDLFNILYEKEQQKCIDGDELCKLYVESEPNQRERVYENFKELYKGSNPDTKAYLMNLERWKMKKSRLADKLREQLKREQEGIETVIVELPYLQDGIKQLNECSSVDELVKTYENISPSIATMLKNEDMLDKKKNEHKKAFGTLSSTYFSRLRELEGVINPIAQCNNNQILQLMYNRINNLQPTEDVMEVLNGLFDVLMYRQTVLRMDYNTEESKYIKQKFLAGVMLFSHGRTDIQGMIEFWVDSLPINEENLTKELPISVVDMLMRL